MKRLHQGLLALSCLAAGFFWGPSQAQEHSPFQPLQQSRLRAEDEVRNGTYALAAQSARRFLNKSEVPGIATKWVDEEQRAIYFAVLSSLKTEQPGSTDSVISLLQRTHNPVFHDRLSLALAEYYFLHGQLTDAIPYYESAGIANLSNEEIADAKFELAYCYFNSHRFEQADPLFATIREVPGKYYGAGNYYYGLLAYNKGNYKEALKSFGRIDNEPQYRTTVPYYMAEIEYYLGNRSKALADALRLIKRTEKLYYDNELHLLAAQCLFEDQRYGDALPYFEYYYDHTDKIRKEELYEMAYCYYRVSEWKDAIDKFKPLSNTQDSLGQTAMYLLGDCYLKTGDKQSARNAFGICAGMTYNSGQRKASLLLHGKLSFELGYLDDALRSVNTLIADYGGSNDAWLLQSELFAATNNFRDAYGALLMAHADGQSYRQAMQRVAYGYALQQIQQRHFDVADSLLTVSLLFNSQPAYEAAANFWKGDIAYRQHRNEEAITFSKNFLDKYNSTDRVPSISPEATPAHAYLNMGYASLEQQAFSKAQEYFSKAQSIGSTPEVAANAILREADALFMQKDFARAATLYGKAAAGSGHDADYARLQQAIVYGLQGKTDEKMRLLQSLMSNTPPSPYAAEARYELALTQMGTGKYQQAISMLQPLTGNKENPGLAAKAWLKTGTAYQQINEDEKAIEAYRHIIHDYSAAPERSDALSALKSLYIEHNQPEIYSQLLHENNLPAGADNELDSAYYSAAEAQFADGKWQAAQLAFNKYLQQFPKGAFEVKAHYYQGESFYRQKLYKEALPEYDAVLQNDWNDFSENSAKRAAEISDAASDYAASARYYGLLRNNAIKGNNLQLAYMGLMHSAANMNNPETAARYADTLLTLPEIPEALSDEAKLYQARQLLADKKNTEAQSLYQSLQKSKNGLIAAEARYYTAEGLVQQGKLKEGEDAAGKNIRLSAGYEFWVVKSYILMGDILLLEKDYFNAKATLQSVIQNTKNEALKAEATKKLEEVNTKEHSKLSNE